MLEGWVIGTFLLGLAVEAWLVSRVLVLIRVASVRAREVLEAEARARVAAARAREMEYMRGVSDVGSAGDV